DGIAAERVAGAQSLFSANLPGSYVSESSLDGMRRELAGEESVPNMLATWGDEEDPLSLKYVLLSEWTTEYVVVEGDDQAMVLGAAEFIRRNVDRWNAEPIAPEAEEDGSTPDGVLLRWASNPWAIRIVGGIAVTLV